MAHYYDEKTPQCEGCGWFGHEEYPTGELAGQTYERCGQFCIIFHGQTDEKCDGFMSPRMVQDSIDRLARRTGRPYTYDRAKGGIA